MVSNAIKTLRTAMVAYGAITPTSQFLVRGFAITFMGLFYVILPEVLQAFGVTVAEWKDHMLSFVGVLFIGMSISFGFLPPVLPIERAYKILKENGFWEKNDNGHADTKRDDAEKY